MWQKYNFVDKNTSFKSIIYYLAFIFLVIAISFLFTGCKANNEPSIYYQDFKCNCINPKLDIKNETCICEDGVV